MKTTAFKNIGACAVAAILTLVCAGKANAQYYDYGPGSIAWEIQMQQRENQIMMQNAAMRAQITNYYQQQAAQATWHMINQPFVPMPGIQTYNGPYVPNGQTYTTETVDCEHCDGGYNYRETYMGYGQTRTIRSTCPWCHGSGTVTKKVLAD